MIDWFLFSICVGIVLILIGIILGMDSFIHVIFVIVGILMIFSGIICGSYMGYASVEYNSANQITISTNNLDVENIMSIDVRYKYPREHYYTIPFPEKHEKYTIPVDPCKSIEVYTISSCKSCPDENIIYENDKGELKIMQEADVREWNQHEKILSELSVNKLKTNIDIGTTEQMPTQKTTKIQRVDLKSGNICTINHISGNVLDMEMCV